jgi:hypothetical protein
LHASIRPYATASMALVGASVIAITPIAPSLPGTRIASPAVGLAAASIANVPANLINAFLGIPQAEVDGIERFAAAMQASGSWNESSPNNVWGWDPANPEMLKGSVDMLLPFPALSGPLGEHLNWWAAANLPMYAGCAFECPDPIGTLNVLFRVPVWEFYDEDGYTFGPVINPVDGQPTEWSGQTVKLDPFEPISSVINSLLADPAEVTFPTPYEDITALANLAAALQVTGQLPPWIAVREIETFLKLYVPIPETSSIAAPDSARTFTMDVSALRAAAGNEVGSPDTQHDTATVADLVNKLDVTSGDVQPNKVAGTEVQTPDTKQGGLAVADVAKTPGSTAGDVLITVQDEAVARAAETGLNTASEAINPSTAPSAPIIDLTKDGNKVEPLLVAPKHRQPGGGLTGAVKSVQDTINSSISKITGGLTGGGTAEGGATTDSGEPN